MKISVGMEMTGGIFQDTGNKDQNAMSGTQKQFAKSVATSILALTTVDDGRVRSVGQSGQRKQVSGQLSVSNPSAIPSRTITTDRWPMQS
jgi:hypothetical protein